MALATQSASYRTILTAVRAKLIEDEVLGTGNELIFINRNGEPKAYANEQWINLYPGPLNQVTYGGGRRDTRIKRPLVVQLFTRTQVDYTGDGTESLTSLEIGHIALEEKIIDALHLRNLFDDDEPLLFEPMRLASSAESPPEVDPQSKRLFVTSRLLFETGYIAPLTIETGD